MNVQVLIVVLLAVLLLVKGNVIDFRPLQTGRLTPNSRFLAIRQKPVSPSQLSTKIANIRGGKKATVKKNKSVQKIQDMLFQIHPATRMYLIFSLSCTLVHMLGAPAPALFGLDRSKLYEVWRPFTSLAYLGPPSMSMASSLYFLLRYGQRLESENGTPSHVWFLTVQMVVLTVLGLLLRMPFLASAMISAAVYVSSRIHPMDPMPFQFGFVIPSWQLPFYSAIIDILSQQSMSAAWPHALGIFSGHIYHFFTKIWPELGGKAYLSTPKFISNLIGEKKSNIQLPNARRMNEAKGKRVIPKNIKGRKLQDSSTSNTK